MTDEMIALARRAVACRGWRWMPGMEFDLHGAGHLSGGWRVQSVQMRALEKWSTPVRTITAGPCEFIIAPRGNIYVRYTDGMESLNPAAVSILPFLEDPATLGCLLALVREALHSPRAHVLYVAGLHRWECADNRTVHGVGATEAEALIETLEYAP